jgi:2-polyprenyl-6-methoxyphenol hydroxylase-like FAD-dependent oxidoreductase
MTVRESATCVIAGGGPAGMMLGWLLARGGVDVLVLEKHADFLRDFRGDTIHSSTVQVMDDLGVVDDFLGLPHHRETGSRAVTDDGPIDLADFSELNVKYPFIAYMPQWEFLSYVAAQARAYPTFRLVFDAEVEDLLWTAGRVVGCRYRHNGTVKEVRAELTVAADGRHSALRRAASLDVRSYGAPMDLLWFRLPRRPEDTEHSFGRLSRGRMLAMINRTSYWQSAFVVPKGSAATLKESNVSAFCGQLEELVPWLDGRTVELHDWNQIHVLDVQVDRARRWYRPGLLAIGDAAHAMSVVGGVGVNLAIQDAVATARILLPSLRRGRVRTGRLAAVQRRRIIATVLTQRLQLIIQERFLRPLLAGQTSGKPPKALALLFDFGPIRRYKARLVAVGFRPERANRLPQLPPARPPVAHSAASERG